jgi:hypothetical protein
MPGGGVSQSPSQTQPKVSVFEELSKHNYQFPVELIMGAIDSRERDVWLDML